MSRADSLRWWSPRALLRRILMLHDSPHSIALGTAIGMGIGMTPTVGLQLIMVTILAALTYKLFYFNRAAALLTVYISNPLTVVPIYYVLFRVGNLFVPGEVTREELAAVLRYDGFDGWWQAVTRLAAEIGGPLLAGTVIVAPICGLVTYPVMLWLVKKVRQTKHTEPVSGTA